MNTPGPARLGEIWHFQSVENFMNNEYRFPDMRKTGSRRRIEVEVQKIGPIDIVTSQIPRIQIDAAKIDDPE